MTTHKLRYLMISSVILLASSGLAVAGGDAAAGQQKAASCTSCHGANGEGVAPNPKIAGMDEAVFVKAMADYKAGTRKHMMMEMLAKGMSDEDNANLAAYFATK